MGAAVGRDAEAVKQGLDCLAARDSGSEAFFRRLQSPELLVQSALLVLRQCAVPKLNFLLRCSPPVCIAEQAPTSTTRWSRTRATSWSCAATSARPRWSSGCGCG